MSARVSCSTSRSSFSLQPSSNRLTYKLAGFLVLTLLLAASAAAHAATTWTVNTLGDDATTSKTVAQTNCQSGNDYICTLRDAILAAGSGDTIVFNTDWSAITLGSSLPTISVNLTITGLGASHLTISGNNAYQVFVINSGAIVNISGLTIANGNENCGINCTS